MAVDKIHRGDDKLVVIQLAENIDHASYKDVECSLIDSSNKTIARFNKNLDNTLFQKIIIEVDNPPILAVGVPIDTLVTKSLKDGVYYLLVRFVFDDTNFPDADRRQSDTQPIFQIVPEISATTVSSTIYYYGINGAIKGDDGDSAYQVAVDNGFIGTDAEWLESLKGDQGADGSNPVGAVLRQEGEIAIIANDIAIDFNSRNEFVSTNRLSISPNVTISLLNLSIARFATFKVLVSNLSTITFPIGSISGDGRISSRVFTPESNGAYTISMYITGSEYEIVISSNPAI